MLAASSFGFASFKFQKYLKPEQTDAIFQNAKPPFNLSEVTELLPFISRDVLNRLARKMMNTGNYSGIAELAPFLEQSLINEIAQKCLFQNLTPSCSEASAYIVKLNAKRLRFLGIYSTIKFLRFKQALSSLQYQWWKYRLKHQLVNLT